MLRGTMVEGVLRSEDAPYIHTDSATVIRSEGVERDCTARSSSAT